MKVALLSILFLFQTWAFAQDCADCAPKKLPTPLEDTAAEGLKIASKIKTSTMGKEICLGIAACQFEGEKNDRLFSLEAEKKGLAQLEKKLNILKASLPALESLVQKLKSSGESDPKYLLIESEFQKNKKEKESLVNAIEDAKESIKNTIQADKENPPKLEVEGCSNIEAAPLEVGKCGLYNEEEKLVSYYTGSGSSCLNTYLRSSQGKNPKVDMLAKMLDVSLSKLPSYKGFVRRGADLPEKIRAQHKVGAVVTYPSFTSTSTHYGFEGEDIFYILSKTGKPIMNLSQLSGEFEVLFKTNTKFKILNVESISGVNYYIMKEVISNNDQKDEAEDKEILEKVKLAKSKDDSTIPSDTYICPVNNSEKVPASIQQKKMPGLKDMGP